MRNFANQQRLRLSALPWAHIARAFALSIGIGLLCIPMASDAAVWSAIGAALFGNFLGIVVGRSRVHWWAALTGALLLGLCGYIWLQEIEGVSSGNPTDIFIFIECAIFGGGAFVIAACLRFLAIRWRSFGLLEALVPVMAVLQLLIAHRDGSIHRPYALSDPLLALGWDPVPVFMAAGALAALVMLWVLLRSASIFRTLFHLTALIAFLLLLVSVVQQFGLPKVPEQPWAAGLRPDEKDGSGKGKGGHPPSQKSTPPDFSSGNNENGSNAPVAVVVFHDDYQPSYGVYYFRQGAYSQYNGRRLVAATNANVDNDLIDPFTSHKEEKISAAPVESPYRETVVTDVALISEHYQPFGLEAPASSQQETNPNPTRFQQFYRVTSHSLVADGSMLIGHQAGDEHWSRDTWRLYTEHPSDSRYTELAQKIATALPEPLADDPFARALIITQWLGEQGTYSFRNAHEHAEDPTSSFLFGDLTGYCVHFAHAAVFLMRTLGLPARVANGYAIESSYRRGGSALLIAGSYAHAWPEVYLRDVGWVIVDISPKRSLVPPPEPMDQDLQQLMGEIARGNTGKEEDQQQWSNYLVTARKVSLQYGLLLGWIVLGAILVLCAIKIWRAWFPWLAPNDILPVVTYRALLDRLSEVSLSRAWGESREAFAQRLVQQVPAFATVTNAHIAAAFSPAPLATSRRQLLGELKRFRRERRSIVPWWKRMLGALLPWSWIRSR